MKEPIYVVNITGQIKALRGQKIETFKYNDFLVKGCENKIKNSKSVKNKFLIKHFKSYNKVKEFDLNRLRLTHIEIIESLGFGIAE